MPEYTPTVRFTYKLGPCDVQYTRTGVRRLYDTQGAGGPIRLIQIGVGFRHMLAESTAPPPELLEEVAEYGYRVVIDLSPTSKWYEGALPDVSATRVPHTETVTVNKAGQELRWVAYDVFDPRFRDAYVAAVTDTISRVRRHRAVQGFTIGWAPDGEFGGNEMMQALHEKFGRVIGKDEFMDAYRKLIDAAFDAASGQEVHVCVDFFFDGEKWQDTWTMEVARYAIDAAPKKNIELRLRQNGIIGYNRTIGLLGPGEARQPGRRLENPTTRYYEVRRSPSGEILEVLATDRTIAGFFGAAVRAGYGIEGEDPGHPPYGAASAEDLSRTCEHLLVLNAGGRYPPGYTFFPKQLDMPRALDTIKRLAR
jgi:hypothetical protein